MAADGRRSNLKSSDSSELRHLHKATERQIEIDRFRRSRGELVILERLPVNHDNQRVVEGKGKQAATVDQNFSPIQEASSSGLKIFVNHFGNSSAISFPGSKINVNSSNSINREIHFPIKSLESKEKDTTADLCKEILTGKQIQLDSISDLQEVRQCISADLGGYKDNPPQADHKITMEGCLRTLVIQEELPPNSGIPISYDNSMKKAEALTEQRDPDGNVNVEFPSKNLLLSGNKFNLLNTIGDKNIDVEVIAESIEEELEEGEVLVNTEDCKILKKETRDKYEAVKGSDNLVENLSSQMVEKNSSQKAKLSKELRHLGPLNSNTRLGRNNLNRRTDGADMVDEREVDEDLSQANLMVVNKLFGDSIDYPWDNVDRVQLPSHMGTTGSKPLIDVPIDLISSNALNA
ncbi:hypothetical protein MA16_Dca007749 [Dendrobium catenatum]|uniref:Uncharacterized protein n=1 Tax=Dendrobium catenatum TaxID=906689 RepID=A0A2I0X580_9ASPA|nr:hypothetical protein MA16_Dca007749 [Dendrobium catenatum]